MADGPVKPSKADQDLEVLGRYNSALLHMKGTIDSDNKSLENFTSTFKQFNSELKELIQLTNKNKLSLNLDNIEKIIVTGVGAKELEKQFLYKNL